MQTDFSVQDALGLAMLRRVTRLAQIRDELAAMGWESFITAQDLALLEDHGFVLDFDTARVIDTSQRAEVTA